MLTYGGGELAMYADTVSELLSAVIPGVDLRLATEGMAGAEQAVRRGDAFAGMVLIKRRPGLSATES